MTLTAKLRHAASVIDRLGVDPLWVDCSATRPSTWVYLPADALRRLIVDHDLITALSAKILGLNAHAEVILDGIKFAAVVPIAGTVDDPIALLEGALCTA